MKVISLVLTSFANKSVRLFLLWKIWSKFMFSKLSCRLWKSSIFEANTGESIGFVIISTRSKQSVSKRINEIIMSLMHEAAQSRVRSRYLCCTFVVWMIQYPLILDIAIIDLWNIALGSWDSKYPRSYNLNNYGRRVNISLSSIFCFKDSKLENVNRGEEFLIKICCFSPFKYTNKFMGRCRVVLVGSHFSFLKHKVHVLIYKCTRKVI